MILVHHEMTRHELRETVANLQRRHKEVAAAKRVEDGQRLVFVHVVALVFFVFGTEAQLSRSLQQLQVTVMRAMQLLVALHR